MRKLTENISIIEGINESDEKAVLLQLNDDIQSGQRQLIDNENELNNIDTYKTMQHSLTKHEQELSDISRVSQQKYKNPTHLIHDNSLNNLKQYSNTFESLLIEGPGFYVFGIIDILQEWNFNKKIENISKIWCKCNDKYGISCVEPVLYRKRFLAKMLQIGIGRETV